jgi:error-prone DNA polymerase
LGLRYVKGLRAEIAEELVRQRGLLPFAGIEDVKLRVPAIQKDELAALAAIGALNFIGGARNSKASPMHRRDALWQVERAARRPGPLLEAAAMPANSNAAESNVTSPLLPMTAEERLVADFHGTGMTTGPHPMAYHRADLKRQGIRSAIELPALADGTWVRVAGAVIARQRPGTAKGFVFLSLEDETGIANAIITPKIFAREHGTVAGASFLLVEGPLQNQDNVISVKAERVQPISLTQAQTTSHDFH